MDSAVITTITSTSGAVIVGLGGMWISTNQIGKRIDSVERAASEGHSGVERRLELIESDIKQFFKLLAELDGQ